MRGTHAVFALSGFAFASWASRIPQVRDALGLSPRGLGLVLLAIALGSVVSMPLAGVVIGRLGVAGTVRATALVAAAGLVVTGPGQEVGVAPVVVGLFALGVGNGTWDVAMNVEGSVVERRLGRAIMPRFHASFSVGTVAGALAGAALVEIDVSPAVHLVAVAVVVAVAVPLAARDFLPPVGPVAGAQRPSGALATWREPRTLLIGLFVFAAAFTEGTGNDWLGVAVVDGYDAAPALGALTFALLLAAMTLGRLGRPSADRPPRPRPGGPGLRRARPGGPRPGRRRRGAARRDGRRRPLGPGNRARLPGRHERRGRRP